MNNHLCMSVFFCCICLRLSHILRAAFTSSPSCTSGFLFIIAGVTHMTRFSFFLLTVFFNHPDITACKNHDIKQTGKAKLHELSQMFCLFFSFWSGAEEPKTGTLLVFLVSDKY